MQKTAYDIFTWLEFRRVLFRSVFETRQNRRAVMNDQRADVLVPFGITGDLARVMTFRSLYRLEQRGLRSEERRVGKESRSRGRKLQHKERGIQPEQEPTSSRRR